MRYFLITFSHSKGFGNLELSLESFPSYHGIVATIKEQFPDIGENITITFIYEFRNEQDFNDWIGK